MHTDQGCGEQEFRDEWGALFDVIWLREFRFDETPIMGHTRPLGWAVRTQELDAVARRLGLAVVPGGRTRPDGSVIRWRLAGVEQAVADAALPFFIEWEPGATLPGDAVVEHPDGPSQVAKLVVEADRGQLEHWLGPHALPLEVRPGKGGVVSVIVERMPSGAAA